MPDYSNINKKLTVPPEKTAEFLIDTGGDKPIRIQVAPAMEVNRGYFNARLAMARSREKAMKTKVTVDNVESERDDDRALYVRYIIKGWAGVIDGTTGLEVEFTVDNLKDFLDPRKGIPNYIFDDLRKFARDESNFIDIGDAGPIAKN